MGWGEGGELGFGHCELEVPVDFLALSCECKTDQCLQEWSPSQKITRPAHVYLAITAGQTL